MARFFINTGDGIDFASTEDEARKVANESLDFWRKEARNCAEWSDEAGTVYWGEIRERAKFKQLEDDGSGDYVLEAQ